MKRESQRLLEALPAYERSSAILLIFFFSFVVLLNFYHGIKVNLPEENELATPHYLSSSFVTITIKGAVAKPGKYTVPKEALIKEILMRAEPLDGADLAAFSDDLMIGRRRIIHVKYKKKL